MLRFIFKTHSSYTNALGTFIAHKWRVSNSPMRGPMVFKILRLQQRRIVNQISFKKFLTEVARDNHAGLGPTPGGGSPPSPQGMQMLVKFWVTFTYCSRTVDGKTHLSRSGRRNTVAALASIVSGSVYGNDFLSVPFVDIKQ